MKANKFVTAFLALIAAPIASANTFEVTGATAFRRATIEAIRDLYDNASGDPVFAFAHNGTSAGAFNGADFITFVGTIDGLSGTTTIRCSFNGSIEGLRALAEPGATGSVPTNGDPYFILGSAVTITPTASGANQIISGIDVSNPGVGTSLIMDRAEAEMAFSDTDVAISPYNPALFAPIANNTPAVLVFSLVNSEGGGITNVTYQQYNSLLSNGFVRKSMFTGLTDDHTKRVFCTGRNDGSGTRSSYLAEMGFGVANPVNQYLVVGSTGNQITAIQAVPAGGTNDTDGDDTNGVQLDPTTPIGTFDTQPGVAGTQLVTQLFTSRSTVWGQDQAGNGGAFSGSVLRGHLALDGDNVRVFDADGFNLFGGVAQTDISMITWVSLNDAITARANGAAICSFNGVTLDVSASPTTTAPFLGTLMTDADKQKVYHGQYTAWNFQKFYYKAGASTAVTNLYTSIFNRVQNGALGAAGLKNTDMKVGRLLDGGTINPL